MRGIPTRFNTIADIDNSMAVDKAATQAKIQTLLDGRYCWQAVRQLGTAETGTEDATHKVSTSRNNDDVEERWQLELEEDSNAWLFRLGLTVAQAQAYLEV